MGDRNGIMDGDEALRFLDDRILELASLLDPLEGILAATRRPQFDKKIRKEIAKQLEAQKRWQPTQEAIDNFISIIEPPACGIARDFQWCTRMSPEVSGRVSSEKATLAEIALKLKEIHSLIGRLGTIGNNCLSEVITWHGKQQHEDTGPAFCWKDAYGLLQDMILGPHSAVIPRARALTLLALELAPPTPRTRADSLTGHYERSYLTLLARHHRQAFHAAFGKPPTTYSEGPGVKSFNVLARFVTGRTGFRGDRYINIARSQQT